MHVPRYGPRLLHKQPLDARSHSYLRIMQVVPNRSLLQHYTSLITILHNVKKTDPSPLAKEDAATKPTSRAPHGAPPAHPLLPHTAHHRESGPNLQPRDYLDMPAPPQTIVYSPPAHQSPYCPIRRVRQTLQVLPVLARRREPAKVWCFEIRGG